MNNFIKKAPFLLFATFLLMSIWQCSSPKENNTTFSPRIPMLIERSTQIQLGTEWDKVQNTFAQQKKKLATNPNDPIALLTLSNLYVNEARVTGEHGHYYPAALKVLDQLLSNAEISADQKFIALTNKAGVELSLHDFAKAKNTALAAFKINPSNAQVHGALVDAYVELGEYKNAIFAADKMNTIKPDIRSYSRISYLREIHGDVDGAIEAMHMAVTSGFPGTEASAWAMLTLGELYQRYDQPKKAKAIYEAILAERPDYPFAIGALASLSFEAQDYVRTEMQLQQAIEIIPEVGFYVQLAELYQVQGKEKEKNNVLNEIFVMLEDDVVHGHNMNLEYANIYLDLLSDKQKAKTYALAEYNKRPNNIDVNLMMAKIYLEEKDINQLDVSLEKAARTNSKNPILKTLQAKSLASI